MNKLLAACLGSLALACAVPAKASQRTLGDVAVIDVPRSLKAGGYSGTIDEGLRRQAFEFSSPYLWASWGSITRYKQVLVVSIMAPDASDADYAALPRGMTLLYEQRRKIAPRPLGSGTLTMTEGLYGVGNAYEPAVEYLYVDKSRRLQLAWHAVTKEMDVATAVDQIARAAATFRLVRDPGAVFDERRAAVRREADLRASNLATVQAMLKGEGYGTLVPGRPVLRHGVYLEWMSDPEPRYQLLMPLGRVRAAPGGTVVGRPRPVTGTAGVAGASGIGWRELSDGDWVFNNDERAYLPMSGIGALLAARQQDPAYVYFYVAATVRVEEESDPARLTSLRWFFDAMPEIRRRWREGSLVHPGKPEAD